MSNIKTYSPSKISLVISGYVVEGWTSITLEKKAPTFKQIEGIRGKNTRVKVGDNSSILQITVPITSDLNTILSKILLFDMETGNGRINILVRDYLNGEVFESSDAYISGDADRSYTGDIPDRSWEIICMNSRWSHSSSNWSLDALINYNDLV